MVDIADKPFSQLLNLNILDELRIQGILVLPGGGQDITRITAEYNQEVDDDVIVGTGTFDINLISLSTAIKSIVIRATTGSTLTLIPAGSDTIESGGTPVTSDTAVTLVPDSGTWLLI